MIEKKVDHFKTNKNISIRYREHSELLAFHKHNFLELVYVLDGEAIHSINDSSMTITKGDYFLIDYDVFHQYDPLPGSTLKIINCMFVPQLIDETLHDCQRFENVAENYLVNFTFHAMRTPDKFMCHDSDGYILKRFMDMKEEYEKKEVGYQEMIRSLLIQVLISSMRQLQLPTPSDFEDDMVKRIIEYVNEYYYLKLSLNDITKNSNYALSSISTIFKNQTGYTFRDYVKTVRIRESCRMLATTNKKVVEIATTVGYPDIKFFNKTFKEIMGMSPNQYRSSVK